MKKVEYETLQVGIMDTIEAPKARDIFYKCRRCNTILPSLPKDNVNCECGNIGIDKDMNRLWVECYADVVVLKRVVEEG